MTQKLQKAIVYRYENKLNDYNEQVRELTATFPVEVAVSTTNGSFNSANNVKTTNSTHNGFTYADSLREGDILEVDNHFYNIDFINDNGRFPLLYFKQVEKIEC